MMRILISGHKGRLGSKVIEKLQTDRNIQIFGHDRNTNLTERITQTDPHCILDLTSAKTINEHLQIYLSHRRPTIIGTSGIPPKLAYQLTEDLNFPLLIVPNFTDAISTLLQQISQLDDQWQVEKIIETHHEKKVDTPSATALYLSHLLGNPPITSIRVQQYIAQHEVILSLNHQQLRLTHQVNHIEAFLPKIMHLINTISQKQDPEVVISHE